MTGCVGNAGGLADRLFRFLPCLFGKIPGSPGYVNVFRSLLFSWMSGAAIADAAGLGSVLVPAMKKRGYDEEFALGLTGASSLIDPIMLIVAAVRLFGWLIAREQRPQAVT